MRNQRLQGRITAGRFTLPVVIFTCIACWVLTSFLLPGLETKESAYSLWDIVNIPAWGNRIVSFLLFAAIGYFLIELNNTFAIIRMRASVQTSLYFLLITACPGMHLLYAGDIAAVAFLISLYFLFKSFCGAMTGWSVPYWFLLGHAFFHNEMALFYQPFVNLISFRPIDFGHDFRLWEVVTLGYLFILYVVSSVHCIVAGYEDKIRTRAYLHFLIFLNFCIFLFIVLQPTLSMNLLSLLLIGVSILVGHLFVLTNSRTSNLFFIGSMVALIALFCFNIWTLL